LWRSGERNFSTTPINGLNYDQVISELGLTERVYVRAAFTPAPSSLTEHEPEKVHEAEASLSLPSGISTFQ